AKPVRTWFRELTTLARLAETSGRDPAKPAADEPPTGRD
ncbi:MAG TPA: UDP-3-O-(3-hydroxymyristoyl)glucosamine N-acyltransferase, partial [Methylobacterium sp.]